MSKVTYTAVFEKAEDGTWSGHVPDLPVILATGNTCDEAISDIHIAMNLWLEDRRAQGLSVPLPSTQFVSIEVAA